MSVDTIRVFAISKLDWIKQQQRKLREQQRETSREYLNHESHYLWGRRYLLSLVENSDCSGIELKGNRMIVSLRVGTAISARAQIVAQWYRNQVKVAAADLIAKWAPVLDIEVPRVFVQRMKTRWGGCNPHLQTIRLNTELAKKPRECLEYIVVHELVHLMEPTHNARFVSLMDRFMPNWHFLRQKLNRLPVRHEEWQY